MSYLERIQTCNNARLTGYQCWLIEGQPFGWISPDFARQLARFPDVFHQDVTGMHLVPHWQGYQERTATVGQVMRQLHAEGIIDTWVGEPYPVLRQFGEPAELEVERAASSFLGVKSFGVHLNGLVRKADGIHVWVGTRSQRKPFWPGQLDQMVAGGQPVGISLLDNVIKEAQEEANVPAALAAGAQAVSSVHYRQEGWRGLENSTLFIFDLWLPEDFMPENTDGEVEGFELLPLAEVARLTETTTRFKDNCNLVNIDLLLRIDMIGVKHPDYAALRQALYAQ